jgi:3-hydroxy-9,10-secoandrosta-1,3,5(10)-triene-9,17-dione monooxygenase
MSADSRGTDADNCGAANARAENTAAGQKALRAALLAKASALVPLLRVKAAEAERERRIPDEVLAAIDVAQLFRLRTPKRFGGFEGDPRTYMDVVTELGRGCGSTSWVAFISIATVWIAALFPDEAQRGVFAGNPDVRFMGALGMTARARATDGGYVIDGRWAYASNCLHAHWAVLAAPLPNGGAITPSIMLVPMRDLAIEDTWHVVGMRGTGSHTVIAKEMFVPAHRALPIEVLAGSLSPRSNKEEFVYRESFAPTAIIAVAAPVLGLAQAALDLTLERVNKSNKPIAYSVYDDVRKAPSMQLELAEAATLIETAVQLVRRWCDDIADAARAGEELPFVRRAQMRMDLGYAMRRCREAVGLLLDVQGASAFAESNPIQRVWRDLEMASRHGLLAPEIPHEIYGRALVGNFEPLSPLV